MHNFLVLFINIYTKGNLLFLFFSFFKNFEIYFKFKFYYYIYEDIDY